MLTRYVQVVVEAAVGAPTSRKSTAEVVAEVEAFRRPQITTTRARHPISRRRESARQRTGTSSSKICVALTGNHTVGGAALVRFLFDITSSFYIDLCPPVTSSLLIAHQVLTSACWASMSMQVLTSR